MRDARMWLSLDTSDDVWLHLIAPSGRSGLLNIGGLNDRFKGCSVCDAIRELAAHKQAEDIRIGNGQAEPPAPPKTAWQPIETFPKDGEFYLAKGDNFGNEQRGRHMSVVRWSATNEVYTTSRTDDFELSCNSIHAFLTHWTHLPAYPGAAT